jgi:hypothetical protein
MKERGRYQIQFMKTRSSSGVGQKVDLEFNVDTLRITDLDEPEETSFNSQRTSSTTANIVSQFKKTSAVSETVDSATGEIRPSDPMQGVSVGKVKATADSSRIRSMLANMNSEKD